MLVGGEFRLEGKKVVFFFVIGRVCRKNFFRGLGERFGF